MPPLYLIEAFALSSPGTFPDLEDFSEIIEKFTLGEEGVRNLKRCIETIISKINIF